MSDSDNEILNAIHQGAFKYAESILMPKLRKFPQKSYYWALECVLLLAKNSVEEAKGKAHSLLDKVPTEPQTLTMLHEVFLKLGRRKEATLVFENAARRYPLNNTINFRWFENSLRKSDYQDLQKATMSIQKHDKNERKYGLWASFACWLLCLRTKDAKQSQLFGKLGLRLIEQLSPLKDSQEAFVYVKLLSVFGSDDGIIDFLKDFKSKNIFDLDLKLLYLASMERLLKWNELCEYTSELLFQETFNDFSVWQLYIRSCAYTEVSYESVLSKICESESSRNTALAKIEAAAVYRRDCTFFMVQYYDSFKTKPCCFYDLKYYLDVSNFESLTSYIESHADDGIERNSMNHLLLIVNKEKFGLLFYRNDPGDNFTKYLDIHQGFYRVFQQKKDSDTYPANELLLISMLYLLHRDESVANIVKCICTIHKLLDDKSNFLLRLWLLKLYTYLNCQSPAILQYDLLKIKMLQHDTLSHHLLSRNLFPSKENLNFLINIYRFYLTAEQENQENLEVGFHKQVYNKLESFFSFTNRVNNSLTKYNVILEILRVCRILGEKNYYSYFQRLVKEIGYSILNDEFLIFDNRDFKSHAKIGNNDSSFSELLNLGPKYSSEFIKLNILKELIIMNIDNDYSSKFFKLFNKELSGPCILSQLSTFEKWLYKCYLTLFKLVKLENSKEVETLKNFLSKNLKKDKISSFVPNDDRIILWELNYVFVNLIDLNKIIILISKYNNSEYLKTVSSSLVQDIKTFKVKEMQVTTLRNIKSQVRLPEELIDKPFTDGIFELLENSTVSSSYTSLKI